MDLTPEELTFFKSVSDTDTGRFLFNYVKRLQDHAYDARSWKPNATREDADRIAELLQQFFLDKLRPRQEPKRVVSEFE